MAQRLRYNAAAKEGGVGRGAKAVGRAARDSVELVDVLGLHRERVARAAADGIFLWRQIAGQWCTSWVTTRMGYLFAVTS